MMKKSKTQKGITLIALVITIIVMLILVGVTVTVALNGGLFTTAKDAADRTAAKRNEELNLSGGKVEINGEWYNSIDEYVNGSGNGNDSSGSDNEGGSGNESGDGNGSDSSGSDNEGGSGDGNGSDSSGSDNEGGSENDNDSEQTVSTWTQTGTTVTNGTVTLTVGHTVTNYNESIKEDETEITGLTDVGWKVLGAENGKLLLFSTANVKDSYELTGLDGYYNGISYLKDICDDYGQGKFAESARTITDDDIDRVTGYDLAEISKTDPFGKGESTQYGNEVTYTLKKDADGNVTGIDYTSDVKSGSDTNNTMFMAPDGQTMMSNAAWEALTDKTGLEKVNSVTLTSSYYDYNDNVSDYLNTSSPAYIMLFSEAKNYWLGSSFTYTNWNAGFGLCYINANGKKARNYLWISNEGKARTCASGVRAVVTLNSNVQVESAGTNSWKLSYEA